MTTPKYKEHSADRARRMDLNKPHIYFAGKYGWLVASPTIKYDHGEKAIDYCRMQENCLTTVRTPRDKS